MAPLRGSQPRVGLVGFRADLCRQIGGLDEVLVDDADALCAELTELGVSIVYGPVDRPWGVRSAGFRDPDGHIWQFGSDIPDN